VEIRIEDKEKLLLKIAREVITCEKCALAKTRIKAVPGYGNLKAKIMFIGEAPGRNEDEQGLPFIGQAGKVLDKALAANGLSREDCFIANVAKCRPPNNRVPSPEEVKECMPYLTLQIKILEPKCIVLLGATALKYFIKEEKPSISALRGKKIVIEGRIFVPTYHPAACLRTYKYYEIIVKDIAFAKSLAVTNY
jgi:DNA polymerase